MNSEQEKFCTSIYNKVPGIHKSAARNVKDAIRNHQKYFEKTVPKPKVLARRPGFRIRGQKNPNSTWGRPKGPLAETKRTQFKSRIKPLKAQFMELCSQEKCDPLLLLSFLARSIFLDPNGGHFDYKIGKFFQEITKGNLVPLTIPIIF